MKKDFGIGFFELPVIDFERAAQFYNEVFLQDIKKMEHGGNYMGFFSQNPNIVSGALVQGEGYTPNEKAAIVYFDCIDDLAPVLERAIKAGGQLLVPKTNIGPEMGYFAHFKDSEGNRVGLWSQS